MEVCVLKRSIGSLFIGAALVFGAALPAAAQTFGVGISFLGDEGGTGITADYSKPYKTLANDRTLGWVGDVSFHHKSFGSGISDSSVNTLTFQGGVRWNGAFNEKTSWHVQGLGGILHSSVSNDVCDELDVDCGSDSRFVITPGGGIDYAFNPKWNFRAQLDIPISFADSGGNTTRFWFGVSRTLGN
jgi:hypothetical protein